ncbi:MAG: segregation/condensation protein A [Elusimicrobiota bacterium]
MITQNQTAYDVHLEIFEGPLDLLLYLIKKNDLNIYDIPVSQITAEYMEYLEIMKELNLDVAGEFMSIAATLMQIKSRSLLPVHSADEEEGPDPRQELVNRLLEYQKYKNASDILLQKEKQQEGYFYREGPVFSDEDFSVDATLFDLIESFREALRTLPKEIKEIIYEEIPIEEKIRKILNLLQSAPADASGKKFLIFKNLLLDEKTRMGMVVVFLALLELIRLKQVVARQSRTFGEIRVYATW